MPSAADRYISVRSSAPIAAVPTVEDTPIPAGYGNGTIVPPAYSAPNAPYYVPIAEGGGGGGDVTSVTGGAGVTVSPTTGAVVVSLPNVGTAGAVANPASITTDAQGRVSAVTSLGYTPVAPSALAAYAPLAGATFTGAVSAPTITASTSIGAPAITATTSMGAPTITAGTSISAPAITATNSLTASAASTVDLTAAASVTVPTPTLAAQAVTKAYADSLVPSLGGYAQLAAPNTFTASNNFTGATSNFTVGADASNPIDEFQVWAGDVNLRSTNLTDVFNLTAAGAMSISTGAATTVNSGGLVNVTAAVGDVSIYSALGSVEIGGPVNHITIGTDGQSMSGVKGLTASGGAVNMSGATSVSVNNVTTSGTVNMTGSSSVTVPTPTLAAQAATKAYVDSTAASTASPFISKVVNTTLASPTIYNIPDTDIQGGSVINITTGTAGGYQVLLPAASTILPVGTTVIIQCNPSNTSLVTVAEGLGGGAFRNNNVYPGGSLTCTVSKVLPSGGPIPNQLTFTNGKTFNSISLSGTEATEPVVGTVTFENGTGNIECADIATALLSAVDPFNFISVTDPMQTRLLGVRSADGTVPAEIAMALSESAAPPDILTMKYNPAGADALEVNKAVIADGVNLNELVTFKDARTFYVSKQGSDSNDGSILAPKLTVGAAVAAAIATGSACVVDVGPGNFATNFSIDTAAGLIIRGQLQSDRCIEGTALSGQITVAITGTDNLFNNQIILSDLFIEGAIIDNSTKQHTLIISGCRIEADSALGAVAIQSNQTAADGRLVIQNCVITQEAGSTGANALVSANVGGVIIARSELTVRTDGAAIDVLGTAALTNVNNTTIASTSASATAGQLVLLRSSPGKVHAIGYSAFQYTSSTAKANSPAIRFSSASQVCSLGNNVLGLTGTGSSNAIMFDAGCNPILLVANNRAVAGTASGVQSGASISPLTLVGETAVTSLNSASGAVSIAAGTGIGVSTVGSTITISNTQPAGGQVNSIGAGTGISVDSTIPSAPVVSNSGVISLTAQGGITNVGTAADPIIELSGTGTVTFENVDATRLDITGTGTEFSSFAVYPRIAGTYVPPTEPSQLVPLQYVDAIDTGVQSVSAGDSSITIAGTASDPTVAVSASGVAAGAYTNASITVLADGRVSLASSGISSGFVATNELYVAKNGSDTGLGGPLDPLLTIQEAISRAETITPKTGVMNVYIADGDYSAEALVFSGALGGYIQLNGAAPSQNNAFGVVIGTVLIDLNAGPSDLISRQVILNGLQINGTIRNTSTQAHTVIIQNCRFYPSALSNGMSIDDLNTATENRVLIDNCEYTNDYPSGAPLPCFGFSGASTVSFQKCDIQSVNNTPIIDLGGTSHLQRLENCYLEHQFINPTSPILLLTSTSPNFHTIGLNIFAFRDSTSTSTPAILITGGGTVSLLSNVFDLAGTDPVAGNVVQFSGSAPTVLFAGNSSPPIYASGLQSGMTLVPATPVGSQPVRATTVSASGAISGASLAATGAVTGATVTTTGAIKSSGTLQLNGNVISNASNNTSMTGVNSITMAGTAPQITGLNNINIANATGNATVPLVITNSGDNPHIRCSNAAASTTVPVEINLVNGSTTLAYGNQGADPRGAFFFFNGLDCIRIPTTGRVQMTYSPYSPTLALSGAAGAWVAGTGSFVSGVPKVLGTQTITLSTNNWPIIPGGFGTPAYLGLNGFLNTCVLNAAHNFNLTVTYSRTRSGVTVGPFALYGAAYPITSQSTGGFYAPVNGVSYNEAVVGERITFTHGDVVTIQVIGTYTGGSPPTIVTPASGLAAVVSPFFI